MTDQEAIQLHIAENIHRIEVIEDFLSTHSNVNDKECRKKIDILTKINKALEEVEQYRAIGTQEECREAVEKQREKRPIREDGAWLRFICVNGCEVTKFQGWQYCPMCGQKLKWG